jgi:hypothetical protein
MSHSFKTLCAASIASLMLAGCATAPAAPKEVQSLTSIDVVIAVPQRNFVFAPGDSGMFLPNAIGGGLGYFAGSAVASAGPSSALLGPALGYGVAAALISSVADQIAQAPAREAAPTVAPSVDDIDMRRSVFSYLRASLPAERAAALRLSDLPLPALEPGQTIESNYVRVAARSEADATLFLFVSPLYRSNTIQDPHTVANALLVSRDGRLVTRTSVVFAGPNAPTMQNKEKAHWWADARYRRFLLYSLRTVAEATVDELMLNPAPESSARRGPAVTGSSAPMDFDAQSQRTSRCALETQPERLILRYQRMSGTLRLIAVCEDEALAKIESRTPTRLLADETLGRGGEVPAHLRSAELLDQTDYRWVVRASGATPAAVTATSQR